MGRRDKTLVVVLESLTSKEAKQMENVLIKSKNRHAPKSRGTMKACDMDKVGSLLQRGVKRIGEKNK